MNWKGQVTFTYRASDGMDLSDPATVSIAVTNEAPFAEDDGLYYVDALTLVEVEAPGVLANDSDGDGDPFGAVLHIGPLHAESFALHPDGSFEYQPESGYAGSDWFTYFADDGLDRSAPATVTFEVLPHVDLVIHHGQGGSAVTENNEETVGAFTVANLNDTDGDGLDDYFDPDGVVGSSVGRDEVDLMQLVLKKPNPYVGGTVTLTFAGQVALWEDSLKLSPVGGGGDGSVEFDLSGGDKTIWVEIIAASTALRDVELTMTYQDVTDTVRATGVWATLTAVEHDRKEAGEQLGELFEPGSPWTTMPGYITDQVENWGGTGLRPISVNNGVRGVILQRWTVSPPGIGGYTSIVRFDITRRVEEASWALNAASEVVESTVIPFPDPNEEANDDGDNTDESINPDASDHMFVVDGPGLPDITPPAAQVYWERHLNFEEFVRVQFDGNKPTGDGVSGSRASAKFYWHVREQLQLVNGVWVRTTGAEESAANDIGPGHITIPAVPS